MQHEGESNKAAGGHARANKLSKARRQEISRKAALARWSSDIKEATHGSPDHPLVIGGIELPCYVLEDETRVLSQSGLQTGVGMSTGGGHLRGTPKMALFIDELSYKGIDTKDLSVRLKNPIQFRPAHGGRTAFGYEATILADLCDAILAARKAGALSTDAQKAYAERCELLVRGFARVGIIALVDEATGFQRDRKKDALARILEAFIAKEIQPYLTTFPTEFYEHMFRLRGLAYSPGNVRRPQYFGCLTNDIVYKRLAPGVLEELKKVTPKDEEGRRTHKYFQRLTANTGYPKLKEHLGAVVTMMQLSDNWQGFKSKLDKLRPQYPNLPQLEFEFPEGDTDTGKGL